MCLVAGEGNNAPGTKGWSPGLGYATTPKISNRPVAETLTPMTRTERWNDPTSPGVIDLKKRARPDNHTRSTDPPFELL